MSIDTDDTKYIYMVDTELTLNPISVTLTLNLGATITQARRFAGILL